MKKLSIMFLLQHQRWLLTNKEINIKTSDNVSGKTLKYLSTQKIKYICLTK